jgi:TolA-binding protein
MKKLASLALSLFLTVGAAFADSPKDPPKDSSEGVSNEGSAAKATIGKPDPSGNSATLAIEIDELRQELRTQQGQIQQQHEELATLKEQLAKRDQEIEAIRVNSHASEARAMDAVATSSRARTATDLNTSVADLTAKNAAAANTPAVNASPALPGGQATDQDKGPLSIRFKGISITPGGFIAAETVNRQRAESADINTAFNAIPFGGNSVGKFTEMSLTARQSRLSLLFGANAGNTKLSGYFEADWLGTGVTSNNRESNSYVFRERQLWGRAEFADGWAFSAGQMWSLGTENKKGIANLDEWIPLVVDPQYVVGFTWQRAYGARVAKNFGDKLTLAVSAEGPQATVGGRGFSTFTNTSATGSVTTDQNSFVFAPGSGAGLLNFVDTTGYALNKTPDFIVKAALDPGYGHYEVFGLVSTFRDRVFPCAVVGTTAGNFPTPATPTVLGCPVDGSTTPSVTGAHNDSRTGGGGGFSARFPLFAKKIDLGIKGSYGDGIGRYTSAQLPDATLRPDGTLALIHGAGWLGRIEWHATRKWDLYAYVGGEYAARTAYVGYDSVKVTNTPAIPGCGGVGQQPCPGGGTQPGFPGLTTTSITLNGIGGYGSPFSNNTGCSTETLPGGTGAPGTGGTCAGDTRYIMESTIGFWNKLYSGEIGKMQWGIQYSYFYRNTWSGSNGLTGTISVAPHAVDNMVWTSFRYYLP